jgi:predicted CoA-binding protein
MDHEQLRRIFEETKIIAVVGASSDPSKSAHEIPAYLAEQDYRVIPVSPKGGELFGEPVRAALRDIDVPVDVVDVFRPPEEATGIAEEAVAIGAKRIWFQPGTESDEAIHIARAAGLEVVAGRCMGTTHGALGLGPGP